MTLVSDIRELRKNGQLDEALELAKESFEQISDDIWLKREMAWIYYALAKKAEVSEAIQYLEGISQLELKTAEETLLGEQLSWVCANIAKQFYEKYHQDSDFLSNAKVIIETMQKVVDVAGRVPMAIPSKGYSLFITNLHKLFKDRSGYATIFHSIGFDNFSSEDTKPYKTESGRTILPLAEQIYLAYTKALLVGLNREDKTATIYAEEFVNHLQIVSNNHPEFLWTEYSQTKLLIALNRASDAVASCVDFIKKKPKEFWAWECLGQVYKQTDAKLSMSCYCMALMCNSKEEFLVNTMENAAELMAINGFYNEARTEIERAARIRRDKWGKTSTIISALQSTSWYVSSVASTDNIAFYKTHSQIAQASVFGTQKVIVITNINFEKRFANYISEGDKVGFFNFAKLANKVKVKVGQIYKVTFIKEVTDGPSDVLSVDMVEDISQYSYLRKIISGEIKILPSGVGFIEDCFVSPEIIKTHNLTNGQKIAAIAIRSYNRKKQSIGWSVINLSNAH